MKAGRGKSRSGVRSALVDAGPALAGVGTMLVGVAAVAALFIGQSSTGGGSPTFPGATHAVPTGATAAPSAPSFAPASLTAADSLDGLLARLDLVAADAGVPDVPAAYPDSIRVGPQGGVSAELPSAWPPARVDPWTDIPPGAPTNAGMELLGSFVIGSPDVEGIYADPRGTYDVPMLIISASRRLALEADEGAVLGQRSIEFSIDCRLVHDGRVEFAGYVGPYRLYERCGSVPMVLVAIEARDQATTHLVSFVARLTNAADLAAFEHLVRTFKIEAQGLPI